MNKDIKSNNKNAIAKILMICVLATIMMISLVACNNNAISTSASDVLIVGTTTSFNSLNRLDAGSGTNSGYNFDVIAGTISQMAPVAVDENGEFVPSLTTFSTDESGAVWTFTVKDGYKWHDSKLISSEDLVFTLNNQFGTGDKSVIESVVVSVEKANTIILTLKKANPRFLSNLVVMRVMPKHLLDGKTKETLSDADSVVGSGPFKFSKLDKNSGTLEFVKFAEFPEADKISLNKVIFKTFKTADVMHLALKSGDIDIEYNYAKGIDTFAEKDFKNVKNIQLDKYSDASNPMNLIFNNQIMTNKNVRKAIAKAIDFSSMRNYFGTSFVSSSREGFVSSTNLGYIETPEMEQNLEEAKTLLVKEGYSTTNKYKFNLLVRNDGEYTEIAKVMMQALSKTGMIEMTITVAEPATFNAIVKNHTQQACLLKLTAFGMANMGGLGSMYFVTDSNVPAGNIPTIADGIKTEFGEIVESLQTATTDAEYRTAAKLFQEFCAKETPAVSLFNDSIVQAYSTRLSGFKVDGTFGLLNMNTWLSISKK